MIPLLSYQQLLSHVDGTQNAPPPLITNNDKSVDNPAYITWIQAEQQAIIILNASLTEEALSVTVGLSSARDIWVDLDAPFCNTSVERVQNLWDNLRALKKGDKPVAEFGRTFKAICDQLSAIGHPVDSMDQLHWFLCGLGTTFENFSTTIRSARPIPNFSDLQASAESHELFVKNLQGTNSISQVAFTAQSTKPNTFGHKSITPGSMPRHQFNYRGHNSQPQYRSSKPPFNNYRGSNRSMNRTGPTCQLCRKPGHYATQCYQLATFAASTNPTSMTTDDQLAQAFHAQCHLNSTIPDWTSDTGASSHMLPTTNALQNSTPIQGNQNVYFGNGQSLPITHVGNTKLTYNHYYPIFTKST
ncbi:hypothetical protein E3N88_30450 [Mikania micrantha]|uniref:Retrovirus-related Pol polyprotein from transposon TNT 1-94-like beta-barrel domain-containing protein n=1 Tax=Mikania micrantha TaxID=192012 RepID=A0A5N6MMD3_9ASTR|nr:hypothetical protein E3N88_30450 [Mikania micrantha]